MEAEASRKGAAHHLDESIGVEVGAGASGDTALLALARLHGRLGSRPFLVSGSRDLEVVLGRITAS